MIGFKQRDIISILHFNKEELLYLLDVTKRMEQADYSNVLKGKVLAALFF